MRFPNWFRALVETFDCMQEGAAKYVTGILEKGEDWVMPPHSPDRVLEEFLDAKSYPGCSTPCASEPASNISCPPSA